jgi:hypothetical protein
MERRSETSDVMPRVNAVVDPRMSLALWLRAGRTRRGMSLDDVAKITKIQARILERIEAGKLEGLPADVFVRGFVRSVARCVGLEETEALRRYAACGLGAPPAAPAMLDSSDAVPTTMAIAPTARALVEAMAELVPDSASHARATPRTMLAVEPPVRGASEADRVDRVEVVDLAAGSLRDLPAAGADAIRLPDGSATAAAVSRAARGTSGPARGETASEASVDGADDAVATAVESPVAGEASRKKKRRARAREKRAARLLMATGTPHVASPIISAVVAATAATPEAELVAAAADAVPAEVLGDEPIATATWSPTMPAAAPPSVPWRRPAYTATATAALVPSLVIDDADPESAERVLEDREDKHVSRRSFLPPILLDREDRSVRQGGLTLAVIILLIAATLTLSYLMRRPSASGDGMTWLEQPASHRG